MSVEGGCRQHVSFWNVHSGRSAEDDVWQRRLRGAQGDQRLDYQASALGLWLQAVAGVGQQGIAQGTATPPLTSK